MDINAISKRFSAPGMSNFFLGNYYSHKKKVDAVILNKPHLTSNEILGIIWDISGYQFDYYEKERERSYFQEILDIYDDSLSTEDRWECLLKINTKSYFETYAKKHYDEFRLFLKDKVFVANRDPELLDDLDDFQFFLDYRIQNNFYKVRWISFSPWTAGSLWCLFGDELRFFGDGDTPIQHYHGELLREFDFSAMLSFLTSQLNSSLASGKDAEMFFSFLSGKLIEGWQKILDESNLIDKKEDFKKLANLLREFHLPYSKYFYDFRFFNYFYNEYLRKKAASFPREGDDFSNIYSLSYLQALNELEETDYDINSKSSLYLKCFQVFLREFLKNFHDVLEFDDLVIVEILFRRVICRKDISNILRLQNRLMLWHYYKTEEFTEIEGYSLEEIKKYKAKNYLKLVDLAREELEKYEAKRYLRLGELAGERLSDNGESLFSENFKLMGEYLGFISLLNAFGYDDAKKVILAFHYQISDIADFLKGKSDDYLKKFRNVFIPNLSFFQNNPSKMRAFFVCYDFLIEQEGKATFTRTLRCVESLTYALFPNNMCLGEELEKLNLVAKGDPLKEKIAGIKLYDEYRFRLKSTIPDVSVEKNGICGKMVDMHAPEIISNGIGKYALPNKTFASSCLTPAGKASSCLRHGAVNENGRFFGVYYQGNIVAYSWVWRRGDVLAFDNIEVTREFMQLPNYQQILFDIYRRAALNIIEKTKGEKRGGIRLVVIGRNAIDVPNLKIDSLPNVRDYTAELFQPTGAKQLYMKDSESKQVILAGKYCNDLNLEDVEATYLYQRGNVRKFQAPCTGSLKHLLQAIQFDDSFYHNKRYHDTVSNYQYGYYNDDWFVGYLEDGSYQFFYRGNDERLFDEAKNYLKDVKSKTISRVGIVQPDKKWVERILDKDNILVNEGELKEYFQEAIRRDFSVSPQDYYHYPGSIAKFQQILADRAITSADYGKHIGGNGSNGKYFISVARYGSEVFHTYLNAGGFLLDHNLCTFPEKTVEGLSRGDFCNSMYPLRSGMANGEEQVFREIQLDDKARAIYVSDKKLSELGQIIYLADLYHFDLPFIDTKCNKIVDHDYVKKYIKIKS